MGEFDIYQKRFISEYRKTHKVPTILNDEAVVEMIRKEMIKTGKIYPEFASLVTSKTTKGKPAKPSVWNGAFDNSQVNHVEQSKLYKKEPPKKNQYTPMEKSIARKYIAAMLKAEIQNAIFGEQGFNKIANPNKMSGSEAWQELEVLGANIVHGLHLDSYLGHLGVKEPLNREGLEKELNLAYKQIEELEALVDNPTAFDKKYKELTHGIKMDYSAIIDYLKAINEHRSAYIQDKLGTLEKLKEPAVRMEKTLTIPAINNFNKWAGIQGTAGELTGLSIDMALAYMSGGMSTISKVTQITGRGVAEAVTKKAVQSGLKKETAQIAGMAAELQTDYVMGSGLNAGLFSSMHTVSAVSDGNLTGEELSGLDESYWSFFRMGYVGSSISGPTGAKFAEWIGKVINNEKTISIILNASLKQPTTLGKILTGLSNNTDIIQKATKFGTSFLLNTEYMALDSGLSFGEAMENLAKMEGVSQLVMAFLGGKTTKFLTPEKVQKITTEIENCKVEVAVYRGQKAIKVTTPEGVEHYFASHEELIGFVADRIYSGVGINIGVGVNEKLGVNGARVEVNIGEVKVQIEDVHSSGEAIRSNNKTKAKTEKLTADDTVNSLIRKLQTKTDYFMIREFIDNLREISKENSSVHLNEKNVFLEIFYKDLKYIIEYDSLGNVLGYQTISYKPYKTSYFKYDELGKLTETDQLGFNTDVKCNTHTTRVNDCDYILKNKSIPVNIAKKMLSYEYHFTKDTVDEMLSLVKNENDWKIIEKLLSTKGDTRFFVRTTANTAVKLFDRIYKHNSNDKYRQLSNLIDSEFMGCPFTSYDIVKILKSEEAKQYVNDCIKNNRYCDRDKIKKYIQVETVEKEKLSDLNDLSYETQELKLQDIENVTEKYKIDKQVQQIVNAKIPVGEVGSINGKLYCRANGELIPVQLSKKTFETLFPVTDRYNIKQGNVGNCWLVSDIGAMMSIPNGRANIYSYFREEGGNIFVKLPDTNIEVCFNYEKWKSLKTDGMKKYNGIKMLEQAVAFAKSMYSVNTSVTVYANDKSKINNALKILEGGHVGEGLSFICGRERQKNLMFYNVYENNFNKTEAEATKDLDIVLSEIDTYLKKNPNAICPIAFEKSITVDNVTFDGSHACRIVGYNKEKQTIKIVNPHDGNTTVSISLKSFLNSAGMINLYSISTNSTHDMYQQFSAKKLHKGFGIYL